ncbi:Unc-112- protein [Periplaneta americana]|uniref:Unc-112- protein n=1 Tax=Periplaneta americana TaxID=6978 RepID=A0ABQ8SNA9_PERAM|nr:Unc-112- protein [Periplaneta americana]
MPCPSQTSGFNVPNYVRPKRFTLKQSKQFWFTCRDLHLTLYKSREEASQGAEPAHHINLRGCEVTPEVNIAQGRYGIKLEVPSAEGMTEMFIRCNTEEQYAKWMAACRLAAKGRSLADSSYDAEVKSIIAFLQMQHPAPAPAINPSALDIIPEDYVSPRFLRKFKGKLVQRILEAHANVKDLPLVDAKLNYIKAWQSLPEYGISLFIVKFMGHKKEELLGVAFNRLMRMDISTGDHIKTWRYNTMKTISIMDGFNLVVRAPVSHAVGQLYALKMRGCDKCRWHVDKICPSLSELTAERWQGAIQHVIKEEDRMFQLEGITDAVVDRLVINPADDSSDDSDLEGITPLSDSD